MAELIFTVTAEVDGQCGYPSLSQGDGDSEHVLPLVAP